MRYKFSKGISVAIGIALFSKIGFTQTLFQRPDTAPNYAEYKYPDECLTAVRRSIYFIGIKDTIWRDTAAYDSSLISLPIPESAVNIGRLCLSRMNIESIAVEDYDVIVPLMLLLNRDDDLNRLVQNALNNTPVDKKESLFTLVMREYGNARPKRLELLEQLLARKDNPYGGLLTDVSLASVALSDGKMEYASNIVSEIMHKNGKYVSELSKLSFDQIKNLVYPLVKEVMINEAVDSFAISTFSYRKFLEGIWSTLSSRQFSDINEISGKTLPVIKGDFWYTNRVSQQDTSGSGEVLSVSEQVRPALGKINAVLFLQGGCHSQSMSVRHGRNNGAAGSIRCWKRISLVKRLKKMFPEIEVTIVTKTFGSIGNSPPLEPKHEADTLAEYFLGFHNISGVNIIAETDFARMPGYDRRRVDLEVDFEYDLQDLNTRLAEPTSLVITDEYGNVVFSTTAMGYLDRFEPLLIKMIGAVTKRLQQ